MSWDPEEIKIFVTGVIFIAYRAHTAYKKSASRRKIADTPRSKIATAPQGAIEVQGFAWKKTSDIQTLSQKSAGFCQWELQEQVTEGSGKNKRKVWKTRGVKVSTPSFYVFDETGCLEVVVEGAGLEIRQEIVPYERLPEMRLSFIQSVFKDLTENFPPKKSFFGWSAKFRILERAILNGAPVYAHGNFVTGEKKQVLATPEFSTFASRVIDVAGRRFRKPSKLMDKNKDGVISAEEAIAGYHTLSKVAEHAPGSNVLALPICGVLSSDEHHPLLFADRHEKHLLKDLNREIFLSRAAVVAVLVIGYFYYTLQQKKTLRGNLRRLGKAAG